jgi:hypothetical protein
MPLAREKVMSSRMKGILQAYHFRQFNLVDLDETALDRGLSRIPLSLRLEGPITSGVHAP